MASVNKVILLGNLGQDPELKYTTGGQPVCTMSIATSEKWNDKDGNAQEATEWHRVIVWGKPAENCAKYLAKGRSVYLEGKLQTRSWDDKTSGQKRYATEIVAQSVQFLSDGKPTQPQQRAPQQSFDPSLNGPERASPNTTPNLDDIPF